MREDINSEWRKFDVAEIHNVRSSVNFTERIFSLTLPCAPVNSGKKTKTLHLLQVC